jgi:hypothetical protein
MDTNWGLAQVTGAELIIESQHVLRGRWGSSASQTDGGPWVFIRH